MTLQQKCTSSTQGTLSHTHTHVCGYVRPPHPPDGVCKCIILASERSCFTVNVRGEVVWAQWAARLEGRPSPSRAVPYSGSCSVVFSPKPLAQPFPMRSSVLRQLLLHPDARALHALVWAPHLRSLGLLGRKGSPAGRQAT